jgi:tetratricopeptide (TPR) repeat protein
MNILLQLCRFLLVFLLPLQVFSQDSQTLFKTSFDRMKAGDYEGALYSINKLIARDSASADFYLLRAKIHYSMAAYNKTVEDCYKALSIQPEQPDVFFLRGQVCLVTESYSAAAILFTKAIDKYTDPDKLFRAYLNRGQVYQNMGKNEDAIKDFMVASEIASDSICVLMPLAETYLNLKKFNDATATLEKIQKINEGYPPVYHIYGNLYFENRNYLKAAENYEKYLIHQPSDAAVLNKTCFSYYSIKDYENARIAINRSLTCDPKNPESYKLKGMILLETGVKEEGCDFLFRAFQLGYIEKVGKDLIDIYIKNCEEE